MKRLLKVLAGVIAVVTITIVPAKAITVIDFGTGFAGNGGTILFDGTHYTGTNIPIGVLNVTVDGNNDVYSVDAVLNFSTALDYIGISGTVADLGITNNLLLSGSFDTFSNSFATSSIIAFYGQGPDVKSAELLNALGVPLDTQFAFYGFSLGARLGGIPGVGNTYYATSTDIMNVSVGVPEPGTLLLLGTGLLGLGLMRRRSGNRG